MMKVPFNDLSRAAHAQSDDLAAISRAVIDSGWFVHGPHWRAFQTEGPTTWV